MKNLKLFSVLIAIALAIGSIPTARAEEIANSTSDCESQVAQIMADYESNPEEAEMRLESIGVELLAEPTLVEYYDETGARKTSPSDYTLKVYAFKKTGSLVTYLQWLLEVNAGELFPGPLDYVSLEWDTNYASYYASSGDGVASTVRGKNLGIVVFNLEDDKLDAGDQAYGTLQVYREKTGWLEYGAKFVHTYTSFLVSGSASISYAPSAQVAENGGSSLGLSYTYGFTVNVSSNTSQWELWADNAVKLN